MWLYYFPIIFFNNRLPQIGLQNLLSDVLEARYPKSRDQQGLFLLGAESKNVFYASLPGSSGPWHSLACRCITTICLCLPCYSPCLPSHGLLMRTPVLGLERSLIQYDLLTTFICRDHISKEPHSGS